MEETNEPIRRTLYYVANVADAGRCVVRAILVVGIILD